MLVVHPGRGISGKGYQLKGSRSVGYRLGDMFIDIQREGMQTGYHLVGMERTADMSIGRKNIM